MLDNVFKYSVNYKDHGNYSCEESGCHDEGICRCYSIHTIEITNVSITSITEKIFKQVFDNESQYKRDKVITDLLFDYDSDLVNKYCIHRILTILKVWNPESWSAEKISGYYGDEVGHVLINSDIFEKISFHVAELINLTTLKSKIEYVLKLEYGHILDSIKDKEYSIVNINIDELYFSQKNHHKNVLNKNVDFYSDKEYLRDSIRGVAEWSEGKWRVIDGYHRLSHTKFPKVRIIGIK